MSGFTSLPSKTPFSPVRTSERLDPLFDAVWTDSTQAAWLSRRNAERRIGAGLGYLPKHLSAPAGDAWARFLKGPAADRQLSLLGAVDSWRTMTAEQAAALTGHHRLASGRDRAANDLFAMDLLEVGVFADTMRDGNRAAAATLYRPAHPGQATAQLEESLTYPEWVSVTGGGPFEFARQYDRHNLLATELGLRVAEFCDVGTVLGEKLSTFDHLLYSGWSAPALAVNNRAADLTVVRPDGLRIAVELTASQGNSLDAKIGRWANSLAARRIADTGVVVLFVVVGRPDAPTQTAGVAKRVRHAIATSARLHPGPAFDRTAERMMVATWESWFPDRGEVTDRFARLTVQRPTGDGDDLWEDVNLLDRDMLAFEPSAGAEVATAVLRNSSGLRGTPHWLRTASPPNLSAGSLARAGFADIPRLRGATDKGVSRAELGSARGNAGAPQTPPRLRF